MDHFNMIIMKRILSVLSFTMLTVPLFAHAGMFDRFLEQMVSYRAILVTILTVHILLCIGVKLLKNKLSRYKRALLKAVKHIRKKKTYTITYSWILCSFVYGVYVCLLASQIFLFGGLVILIFLPTFAVFFLRKKWREKLIFGKRAIYCYLQSSIFMSFGISLYLILCNCEWFRSLLSYTDAEYQLANFYLYPKAEAIILLAAHTFELAIILIIPYLVFLFFKICKNAYNKLQSQRHEG